MDSQKAFNPGLDDINRRMGVKHPMSSEPMYPPKKRALYEHKLLHGIENYPVNSYHSDKLADHSVKTYQPERLNKENETTEKMPFLFDKTQKGHNQIENLNSNDKFVDGKGIDEKVSHVDLIKNSMVFNTAVLMGHNEITRTHCLIRPRSDSLHSLPSITSEISETTSANSREPSPFGLHAIFDHQTPERNPVFGPAFQNRVISKPLFPPTSSNSSSSDSEQSMGASEGHLSPELKNYGKPSETKSEKVEKHFGTFKSNSMRPDISAKGLVPAQEKANKENQENMEARLPSFSTFNSGIGFTQGELFQMKPVATFQNGLVQDMTTQSVHAASNMGPMVSLLGKFNAQASLEQQRNGTFSILSIMKDSNTSRSTRNQSTVLGNVTNQLVDLGKTSKHETSVLSNQALNCGTNSKSVNISEHEPYDNMDSIDTGKEHVYSFKCPECSKVFIGEEHYQQHLSMHAEKALNCWVCKEAFNGTEKLLSHMKANHNGVKPYRCQHCLREFGQYNNLRRHLRVHREKKFKCTLCDREFNEEFYLKMHMSTHTGRRAYSCGVCSATFPSSNELKVHVKTHSPSQLHTCNFCGKSFSKACVLRQHKKGHSGERPHKCEICQKTFIHRHHLTMHMRSHTDQKMFICDICHKEFAQSSHLYKHLRSHEENGEIDVETRMRHASGMSVSSRCSDASTDNVEKAQELCKKPETENEKRVQPLRENDSRVFERKTNNSVLSVNPQGTSDENSARRNEHESVSTNNLNMPEGLNTNNANTSRPIEQRQIEISRQSHEMLQLKTAQRAGPWIISKPKSKKKVKVEIESLPANAENINDTKNTISKESLKPVPGSKTINPPSFSPVQRNQPASNTSMPMSTKSETNQSQTLPSMAQTFGLHPRHYAQFGNQQTPFPQQKSAQYRMQLPMQLAPYPYGLPYMPMRMSQPNPIGADPRTTNPMPGFHGYDPMFHPYAHPMHVYYSQMYWMNCMDQNRMIHQGQEVTGQGQESRGHQVHQEVKGHHGHHEAKDHGQVSKGHQEENSNLHDLKGHQAYLGQEGKGHDMYQEVKGQGHWKSHQLHQSQEHFDQSSHVEGGEKNSQSSGSVIGGNKNAHVKTPSTTVSAHSKSSLQNSVTKNNENKDICAKRDDNRVLTGIEDVSTRTEVAHQLLKMAEQKTAPVWKDRPNDQYELMTSTCGDERSNSEQIEQCAKNRNSGNVTIYSSSEHLMNMYKVLSKPGKELMKLQNFVKNEKEKMNVEMMQLEVDHSKQFVVQHTEGENNSGTSDIHIEQIEKADNSTLKHGGDIGLNDELRADIGEEKVDMKSSASYFEDSLEDRALEIDLEKSMNDSIANDCSPCKTAVEGRVENLKSNAMCTSKNQDSEKKNCSSYSNESLNGNDPCSVNKTADTSIVETERSLAESDFSEEALDLSFNRKHNESVNDNESEVFDKEANKENERPVNPSPRTAQNKHTLLDMGENEIKTGANEHKMDELSMKQYLYDTSFEIKGVQCRLCKKTFIEAADLQWHMLHHMKVKGQDNVSPKLKAQGHSEISPPEVKGQNVHVTVEPRLSRNSNIGQFRGEMPEYVRKAASTVLGEISPNKKVLNKSPRKSMKGLYTNRENVVRKSPRKAKGHVPFMRHENIVDGENVSPKQIRENMFSSW